MDKNVELFLNSDRSESFSEKSEQSDKKNNELETESEKKIRLSLEKALSSNNYSHAFEKINKNISSFCSSIQLLQDYNLCLGSKLDNIEKGADIDKIILKTADEISETFNLIEIIKNFEYNDRNQKIQTITKANKLEDECNKYKKIFDDLTDKIKQKNINLIKQARSSLRYSNYSDFSGEIHLNDEENNNNNAGFQNGKEFLDGIEMKRKQNDAIYKAAQKIRKTISKRSTANIMTIDVDKDNDSNTNHMETFNVEYNTKKNNNQNNSLLTDYNNHNKLLINNNTSVDDNYDNKYINLNRYSSSRNSKAFHDMEDKVFIALEGQRQNCIRRHWILSLITFIVIISILYYLFYYKKE